VGIIDEMYRARFMAKRARRLLVKWVLTRSTLAQIKLEVDVPMAFELTMRKTVFGLPFEIDPTLPEGEWKLETSEPARRDVTESVIKSS
jgi:hypothetical protein